MLKKMIRLLKWLPTKWTLKFLLLQTGHLSSIIAKEGSVVKVGDTIAIIDNNAIPHPEDIKKVEKEVSRIRETIDVVKQEKRKLKVLSRNLKSRTPSGKFISPLVRSIAAREEISYSDLDKISGTGMDGRITKDDIIRFVDDKEEGCRCCKG